MNTHQACSNSHITREVVEQEMLTLRNIFSVDATISNSHGLQFLFPPNRFGIFLAVDIFLMLFVFTSVLNDFHVS
jgi:hypothetical protein